MCALPGVVHMCAGESWVNRHRMAGDRACVDAKVGLCVPGYGSVWTVLSPQDRRGAYMDSRACASGTQT